MGFSQLGGLCLDVSLMGFFLLQTTPLLGFFLLGVNSSVNGIFSLRGLCLHTMLMGFFLLRDDNKNLPMSPFSINLRESKPSAVRFYHLESLLCYREFFLSEFSFNVLLIKFSHSKTQTLAYRLPHLTHEWINSQAVFLYRFQAGSPLRYWGFLCSE